MRENAVIRKLQKQGITAVAAIALLGMLGIPRAAQATVLTEASWNSSTTLGFNNGASLTPTVQGSGVSWTPAGRFGGGVSLVGGTISDLSYAAPSGFKNSQGTVSFWYQPGISSANWVTGTDVLSITAGGYRLAEIYGNESAGCVSFLDYFDVVGGDRQPASANVTFSATDWLYITVEWNSSSTPGATIWAGTEASDTAGIGYTDGSFTPEAVAATFINIGSWPARGPGVDNSSGVWDDLYITDTLLYPLADASITIPDGPLAVPEPGVLLLLGLGGVVLWIRRWCDP